MNKNFVTLFILAITFTQTIFAFNDLEDALSVASSFLPNNPVILELRTHSDEQIWEIDQTWPEATIHTFDLEVQDESDSFESVNLEVWTQEYGVSHIDLMCLDMDGIKMLQITSNALETVKVIIIHNWSSETEQYVDLRTFLETNDFEEVKCWEDQSISLLVKHDDIQNEAASNDKLNEENTLPINEERTHLTEEENTLLNDDDVYDSFQTAESLTEEASKDIIDEKNIQPNDDVQQEISMRYRPTKSKRLSVKKY